ncbi:hypothetical protein CKO00_20540, partial [Enterobacter cloacae]
LAVSLALASLLALLLPAKCDTGAEPNPTVNSHKRAGWCPHPGPLPQGEGANPKNGNFGCHFAFTPGFFYAKKSGPRGPQKFTLALVVRVLRETR